MLLRNYKFGFDNDRKKLEFKDIKPFKKFNKEIKKVLNNSYNK